ncbi:MAG: filamentous hemagglutinin N-terminal domain-containing protein [Iphinoe sp. HA4291-MV1]|nr:filamentous hemagglutinin N-terminal domain-containing protein [Iphinoe sp. HA4291-MV1]
MQRFPITYWLLSGGVLVYLLTTKPCAAQIVPDATLPNNSIVPPNCSNCEITGGTTVGNNLFHSFKQFSIPTGGTAYFNNALTVENIISRVTGKSISNIDGLIRANGRSNLFLLNPNGIIFGPNASLNIGGSFLASTASSLKFADGTEFSASSPQTTPLLTISVPIGLQYGGNAGSIQNQSQAKNSSGQVVGLLVQPGKTLALVGGHVRLDGGSLQAANGRVELGGLAGAGTVGLQLNGNNFSLSYPLDVERADVLLTNAAKVDVADRGSGSVGITARNLKIERESRISAGIKPSVITIANSFVPGDINLNATGLMTINQNSLVENVVAINARGEGGDINIYANRFELTGGGRLRTRTLGRTTSNAGDINIKAGDIYISNPAYKLPGGDPTLEDKPALDASNYKYDGGDNGFGRGRSGNISLEANGSISLIGEGVVGEVDRDNKVISTYSGGRGMGGGNISLKAKGSISLSNANLVTTSITQNGGAGDILLQGDASVSLANNSQLAATNYDKQRNPGNITLRSNGPVSLQSSLVTTDIRTKEPKSDVGNISIFGRSVFITDGSEIAAKTSDDPEGKFGGGFGGSIQIDATDIVEISGKNPLFSNDSLFKNIRPQAVYSTLVTTTAPKAEGPAGNIVVNTDILRVADGGSLKAETQGAFPGGKITVKARIVELTGGGKLLSSASDKGNAGNITLNVSDRITISGTNPNFDEIFNEVAKRSRSRSRSGIQSAQEKLGTVGGDSGIYVSSKGSGQAGDLEITARSIKLDNKGKLFGETTSSDGGNITLNLKDLLLLRRNSQISTSAGTAEGSGNGGNITINALDGFIVAAPGENSDITANAFSGQGGKITINATGIFGMVPRSREELQQLLGTTDPTELKPSLLTTNDITAISQTNPSLSGVVTINTPDVDPSQGLVQLPAEPVNVQVAQGCQATGTQTAGKRSSLAFTGKGGLAVNPYEPLSSSNIWEDVPASTQTGTSRQRKTVATVPDKILEAQGWVINEKGEVFLVAEDSRCSLQ